MLIKSREAAVSSIELGTAKERIVEWRVNLENFYLKHLSRKMKITERRRAGRKEA